MRRKPLGTHALVTGGSRGVGPVIARELGERGLAVTLVARSQSGLDAAAAAMGDGARVRTVSADLRDPAARSALVGQAQAELGPVDVLVHNAAADHYVAFRDQPLEQVTAEVETNLLAPLHLTGLLLGGMLERNRGHVVSIGSVSGKLGLAYKATYSATKAGLIEWSNALRAELRGTGVGVSVVLPGIVEDVGVFARQGVRAPRLAGTVTGQAVARAVVRAIESDAHELFVTPRPTRPTLALDALWPPFGNWLLRHTGVIATMARLAAAPPDPPARR
jgi:short-subunit dehydrogenase